MERKDYFRNAFEYLRSKGIIHTQKDVANVMNIKASNMSKAFNNKDGYLTDSFMKRFNDAFNGIFSVDWLLSGEGEMLSEFLIESVKGDNIEEANTEVTNADEKESENDSNDQPETSYTKGVPYYNVDFIGGFDVVLNDQTINPEYLIDFKKYNHAQCWCNVTGHSMYPEITHGDMIALREIEDFSFLPLGEVYAIVTTNGMRTIKRLGGGADNDHYILVPTNKSPEYGIQPIPKKMISKVFLVLGCMKRL